MRRMFSYWKICRKMTPKTFTISMIGLTILLCFYYANYTSDVSQKGTTTTTTTTTTITTATQQDNEEKDKNTDDSSNNDVPRNQRLLQLLQSNRIISANGGNSKRKMQICPKLNPSEADVNTIDVFKDFDFQPTWMKSKEYWDKTFEDRFERQKMDPERPPLKVIIVPHSHNDPGWLKTFEHYFYYSSRQIMNHMVAKLQQYKNLTFIWSEVAFLNAWWEEAHPSKQRALKNLINSGRLEITSGGWVMTDEANSHLYAMVDQLIEGHQWVWTNLGVKPKSGWSVDPFGHGSTQPYLLSSSGLKGIVIQRIHYAWKQWLALKQYGDFRWIPNWNTEGNMGSILTHNQPFDIYSIKHSCGPHPYICLNFDFRKVPGEYTEYSIKAQAITDKNVKEKSELLLEQYSRTGSLFPHNVVLMPLGDDFRYNILEEWDQQYTNYMKLIDYINSHKDLYKSEITFGTPSDYFDEILKRYDQYPTIKGDFFVYSDIFSEGRPAYWSGYFTTRPFMKILDRELESNLRNAEILYTIALNYAKTNKLLPHLKILERDYEKLIKARRNLGLFQHHDAITGTSKAFVMRDYGFKLFEGIRNSITVQQNSIQCLLFSNIPIKYDENIILSDLERDSYEKLIKKTPINLGINETRKIILYNSLAQSHEYFIQIRTNISNIKITDNNDNNIIYQINPVWDTSDDNTKLWLIEDEYEVIFLVNLPALSLTTFKIIYIENNNNNNNLATIYCNKCLKKLNVNDDKYKEKFKMKNIPAGDIQLENDKFKILFNGNSGFMKSITRKHSPKIMQCALQFAAYKSAQYHSGAYLFMPDPNERDIEKDVLQDYKDKMSIIITTGPVSSEITVIYGAFLIHSTAIYHIENFNLANGINMETTIDFENPPKNRETELFMRIISDVQNGEPPEFYSDVNGFHMQKRIKVDRIGIEGNYFPITTMAYIQDDNIRLSLLTNHAQGASSFQPGYLEVMLDRRTLYDDSRGMGEGLVDNKKTTHKYWLLIEDIAPIIANNQNNLHPKRFQESDDKSDILRSFNIPTDNNGDEQINKIIQSYSTPSLYSNQISNMLNNPVSIFIIDQKYQNNIKENTNLISKQFPCDIHLLTLRTQPDAVYSQFPSSSALMVLHRQGYNCNINSNFTCKNWKFDGSFKFVDIKEIEVKSLTGIDTLDENVQKFSDIFIEPMNLKTFNITFV